MRGINYLAGLGTIFVFIGIFCFKSAFPKKIINENMRGGHYVPVKNYGKGFLIFVGIVCFLLGALLLLKAINKIT